MSWKSTIKPEGGGGGWRSSIKGEEASQKSPNAIEAGIQGFGQGATLGYIPEAQAATYKPMEKLLDLFGGGEIAKAEAALKAQGIEDKPDTYQSRLAENRARDKKLQESGAYTLGEIGGALATSAVPGMVAGKLAQGSRVAKALTPAASLGGKVAQAAGFGAAQGGLSNPEYTGTDRTTGALTGGLLGGAGQGLVGGIGKFVGKAKGMAEEEAFKALGGTAKEFREAGKDVNAIGRLLIDEKLVRPGDTFTSIGKKAKDLKRGVEKGLDATYDAIDASGEGAFNTGNLLADMVNRAKNEAKGLAGGQKAVTKLQEVLSEIVPEGGNLSASDVRAIKAQIGNQANWDQTLSGVDNKTKNKIMKQVYDVLDKKIASRAAATGSDVASNLAAGNKRISQLIDIGDITKGSASRESARNFVPLTDAMIGAGGATAGLGYGMASGDPEAAVKNALIGSSLGILSKNARKYGRPFTVSALDKIGSMGGIGGVDSNPYLTSAAINELVRQLSGK